MIKFLKRTVITIFLLGVVGFLLRGWVYRNVVTYKSLGLRTNYVATHEALVGYIHANTSHLEEPSVGEIIDLGLTITAKQLYFTAGKNDIDPNQLISSKAAHCVGYSTFFAASCNHLLQENGLSDRWVAQPHIGQLYFLGTNVHRYLNSAFFKDHDFVTIENKTTGEMFAVDPTVYDYFKIGFVSYKK